jgi:DNA-binding response OmpR family regulator
LSHKILVADDEYFITRSLAFMLRKEGYECLTASDGRTALELIRRNTPDLVILDLDMPELDGEEVARAVKEDERLRGVHVVILTAKGEPMAPGWKDRMVADELLFKPFEPRRLLRYIQEVLAARSGNGGTPDAAEAP